MSKEIPIDKNTIPHASIDRIIKWLGIGYQTIVTRKSDGKKIVISIVEEERSSDNPTDTEMLDWLQQHHESLYRVTRIVRKPTTVSHPAYAEQADFQGWSVGSMSGEWPTVREAIMAAMRAMK